MTVRPHHHRCATCGIKVECCGDIEHNIDGEPEWFCREFMDWNKREFRCDDCIATHAARTVRDMLENV